MSSLPGKSARVQNADFSSKVFSNTVPFRQRTFPRMRSEKKNGPKQSKIHEKIIRVKKNTHHRNARPIPFAGALANVLLSPKWVEPSRHKEHVRTSEDAAHERDKLILVEEKVGEGVGDQLQYERGGPRTESQEGNVGSHEDPHGGGGRRSEVADPFLGLVL